MQIYDKKQNFLKNITQQKPLPAKHNKNLYQYNTTKTFSFSHHNIRIFRLPSLCSHFPLTFELILPPITFPFSFSACTSMKKVTKGDIGGETEIKKVMSLTRFISAFISLAIQCVLFPCLMGFFLFILFKPFIYSRYEYTSMYKFIILINK